MAVTLACCAQGKQGTDGISYTDFAQRDGTTSGKDSSFADSIFPGDGSAAGIIYVAVTGVDGGSCGLSPTSPCKTINRGIALAAAYVPPRSLWVAEGTYLESVELAEQVSLWGGFSLDFSQGPGHGESIIKGATLDGEWLGVKAENLTRRTEVVGFTIQAPVANAAGKSSYGILVEDSPKLVLMDLNVIAGNGAPGENGVSGAQGTNGAPGQPGRNGNAAIFPALTCGTAQAGMAGYYGDGGAAPMDQTGAFCGDPGGRGGKGEIITPFMCDGENGVPAPGTTGATTSCSQSTFGMGGKGGSTGSSSCDAGIETPGQAGSPGCAGSNGGDGGPGAGGSGIGKVALSGIYEPASGGDGALGGRGRAGGGGGGGGGFSTCSGTYALHWGGGGGGGGASGCGGKGGQGGGGGGGSFGIFIATGYATQQISDCTITTGNGGRGGAGSTGGVGGQGGSGGAGGLQSLESGAGGDGGKGGNGGKGGDGGGGGGGPSIGIFVGGGTLPPVTNTTYILGIPGSGGTGSGSGTDGATGRVQNVYLQGS